MFQLKLETPGGASGEQEFSIARKLFPLILFSVMARLDRREEKGE